MRKIDSGHQVVVAYESMAYGGSEGTVSLYAKKNCLGKVEYGNA